MKYLAVSIINSLFFLICVLTHKRSVSSVASKIDEAKTQINFKNSNARADNTPTNGDEKKRTANEEFLLGNKFYIMKDYPRAILKYKLSLHLNSEGLHVYANLGNCLRENGEFDESVKVLQKSIFLDEKNPKNWYNLGVTYQTMGLYQDAILSYDHATQLDNLFVNAHYNKGMM